MKPQSVLAVPILYRAFTRLVVGNAWKRYFDEHVRELPGSRILDLGCGPGDILNLLPDDIRYTGVDISREYIDSANRRFQGRGTFVCQSVADFEIDRPGDYDLVLANGVVHHLDDTTARQLFSLGRRALRAGGQMITLDGCFVPGQSPVARWLLKMDRGEHVRDRTRYEDLARTAFTEVTADVRHNLLRMPYTHIILCCRT